MTAAVQIPARLRSPAIYHLLRGDEVVYIGSSVNVLARLAGHPVDWDHARIFPCRLDDLDRLEAEHIAQHKPRLNRAGNTRPFIPRMVKLRQNVVQPAEYLAQCDYVGLQELRTLQIASKVADALALQGDGFPAPAGRRSRAYYWRAAAVLDWYRATDRSGQIFVQSRKSKYPPGARPQRLHDWIVSHATA